MTALRKAAKKALEALDRSDYFGWQSNIPIIKSLREALAQPEPEPVAWMIYTLDGASVCVTDSPSDFTSEYRALPIYATPPQRKPLTVEEIIKIWNDMGSDPIAPSVFSFIACVRKTEQAHGIGGEE